MKGEIKSEKKHCGVICFEIHYRNVTELRVTLIDAEYTPPVQTY